MLTHLSIRDLALVERAELRFGPGLNVLTGETGAGKSVLVGALTLLSGARASAEAVRSGAEEAVVEARLELPAVVAERLRAEGWSLRGRRLKVRRTVRTSGRGRSFVDDEPISLGRLQTLTAGLFDLTGQHASLGLLDGSTQLELLDEYAGAGADRDRVAEAYGRVQALRRDAGAELLEESERIRRLEELRAAVEAIEDVDPQPGEVEVLRAERLKLRNVETIGAALARAEAALYSGEPGAVDLVGRVARELTEIARLDPAVEGHAEAARGLAAEIDDLARGLGRRLGAVEPDPARLDAVEARLDRLERLSRRHGGDLDAVADAAQAMTAEIARLEAQDQRAEELASELTAAEAELARATSALGERRRAAAPALEAELARAMIGLGLDGLRMSVELSPSESPGARGAEQVELTLAHGPKERARPLRRVASGGELARILLCLKSVVRGRPAVQVFDEIDTGLGGNVAEKLGARIAELAEDTQVVVVTHLAPVAAFADRHFKVSKALHQGRVTTRVAALGPGETVAELGRMLGGHSHASGPGRALAEALRARAKGARIHGPQPTTAAVLGAVS